MVSCVAFFFIYNFFPASYVWYNFFPALGTKGQQSTSKPAGKCLSGGTAVIQLPSLTALGCMCKGTIPQYRITNPQPSLPPSLPNRLFIFCVSQVAPQAPPRAGGDGEGAPEGHRPAALLAANVLVARSRSGDWVQLSRGDWLGLNRCLGLML